ncbi:MAG: type II toxin-antitoxin system HicA family toxin [Chroococcidiopsis sp.]
MKVKDVIKKLEQDGWYLAKTKGSHRQYKHPIKKGKVTVAGKPSKDVPIGTLKSILQQAQLDEEKE